ncbi:Beta-lactamase-like protein 2 [Desmophyllum pertusum]|uniref:Beta-lactamase-like protein 2 n=1 Tax=Desmophyllum pertusum TaxID=174260 RepID=A0A9W9YIW2_9CNID|nr:Beta-lactamase-like protein 2 [Desmophyllum pertusum]
MGNKMAAWVASYSGFAGNLVHLPTVEQLSPRVFRILGCNPSPYTLQGTNTYLVGTGRSRILIDTGSGGSNEYVANLKEVLSTNKSSIQEILITHWHPDHVGGICDVLNKCTENPGHLKISKLPQEGVAEEISGNTGNKYSYLKDGDKIVTEGATLKVFPHSWSHNRSHDTLSGRGKCCLFGRLHLRCLRIFFTYMKSLEVILNLSPHLIYPGHGPVVEEAVTKIKEYIEHRNTREKQILEALGEDPENLITSMDIVKKVYVDTPWHLHKAAENNVNHHLTKLEKEGRVRKFTLIYCFNR